MSHRRSTRACMSFDENFKHCTGRAEEDSEDDEETELQQRYKQLREQRGTRALTVSSPSSPMIPKSCPHDGIHHSKHCRSHSACEEEQNAGPWKPLRSPRNAKGVQARSQKPTPASGNAARAGGRRVRCLVRGALRGGVVRIQSSSNRPRGRMRTGKNKVFRCVESMQGTRRTLHATNASRALVGSRSLEHTSEL